MWSTVNILPNVKGVLKQDLSGIQVTTFLGVNNFQNIEAMKLIFAF